MDDSKPTSKKKGKKSRIEPERIAASLTRFRGNVYLSAKELEVSRSALLAQIYQNKHLQQILEDERQGMVDIAESKMLQAIMDKQGWAIIYTLKTQGKKRGWSDKEEKQVVTDEKTIVELPAKVPLPAEEPLPGIPAFDGDVSEPGTDEPLPPVQ
jgi:hypothetical protein